FFLVNGRLALIGTDSGLAEDSLTFVALHGCDGCGHSDVNARATAALSAVPGVQAVGTVNAMPFGLRAGDAGIRLDREGKHFGGVPHFYMFGPGAIEAMGLRPESGRAFTPDDFQPADNFLPASSQVWVTRAHAEHLWPGEDPLGREFWIGDMHFRVAGVLASFSRPNPGRGETGVAGKEWSVIVPLADDSQSGVYVVRAAPADLPRVAEAARQAVAAAIPESVIDLEYSRPLPELRERYFRADRSMAWLLVSVIATMLLVTALGIVGL